MKPVFGLIDGNNFYCSCEKAFVPKLQKRPVVVLSNNDGCAISRSSEAKALGIKMGEPYYLCRARSELSGVNWFSSNYVLYGDMSRRLYMGLCERVPRVEPYSIDEMFLDLSGIEGVYSLCRSLRDEIFTITKIPTCIGWGPTKTLAKLANDLAKKNPDLDGLCDLTDERVRNEWFMRLDVSEVWGLGKNNCNRLYAHGVNTISDFLALPSARVQELLTNTGKRLQLELRGVASLNLVMAPSARKSLTTSRSFGRPITEWKEMREALTSYAARAAEKLRSENLQAGYLSVFIQTNRHGAGPYYANQRGAIIEPASDTMAIISETLRLVKPIWKHGFRYNKAGILLNDLSAASCQKSLFQTYDHEKRSLLMKAMDQLNIKYGRGTLRPSSIVLKPAWDARAAMRSPRYTTHIREIPKVKTF